MAQEVAVLVHERFSTKTAALRWLVAAALWGPIGVYLGSRWFAGYELESYLTTLVAALGVPVLVLGMAWFDGWRQMAFRLNDELIALKEGEVDIHARKLLKKHIRTRGGKNVCVGHFLVVLVEQYAHTGLNRTGVNRIAHRLVGEDFRLGDHREETPDLTEEELVEEIMLVVDIIADLCAVGAIRSIEGETRGKTRHFPSPHGISVSDRIQKIRAVARRKKALRL